MILYCKTVLIAGDKKELVGCTKDQPGHDKTWMQGVKKNNKNKNV